MNLTHLATLGALAVTLVSAEAQDTLIMRNGTQRDGNIIGVDDTAFRLETRVPGRGTATTSVPRRDVEKIRFGPDPGFEGMLRKPSSALIGPARAIWDKRRDFLAIPESNAGDVGCLLAEMLLLSADAKNHAEAAALFAKIEKETWSPATRSKARAGRVRAMLRLGDLEAASEEARQLTAETDDPELLVETKFELGRVRLQELQRLQQDNPRWEQDPPVRTRRQQLLQEAADLFLHPFLFHGRDADKAARGLWHARELYVLAGDPDAAKDVLTDIVEFYPDTAYGPQAREALKSLQPKQP